MDNSNDNSSRSADQGSDDPPNEAFQTESSAKTDSDKSYRYTKMICDLKDGSYSSSQVEGWRATQPTGPQEGSEFTVEIPSEVEHGFSDPISNTSGEDVDRIPEVKDLKLGRCKRCIKSNT
jgi:hypothetical protein